MPALPIQLDAEAPDQGGDKVIAAAGTDIHAHERKLHAVDPKTGKHVDSKEEVEDAPAYDEEEEEELKKRPNLDREEDLITQVLHVEDNPEEVAVTFRTVFLGVGLSCFASVLQEIFYFKPQTVYVSLIFITVIAYVLGDLMAFIIPRKGFLKYLNPGPFTAKEHAAITIMASASAHSALSTEALAAQELFYGGYPSKAAGIFVTISSQLIGFGVAGMMRAIIVHPAKMVWPMTLPVSTLLESIHRNPIETKHRMRVWYIVFFAIFIWELVPEYFMPLMTGVSVFCLAGQNNQIFTHLFGGASGNEGLGMLSLGFDWVYIAPFFSPLWYPLQTTVNALLGICTCYALFMGIYYGNIWDSQKFPFLSQSLFNGTSSNGSTYVPYDQSLILDSNFQINQTALAEQGTPYLTGTYAAYLITSNAGMTATFGYMLLWHWDDLKKAWSWCTPSFFKETYSQIGLKFWKKTETEEEAQHRIQNDPELDPHYKLMMRNGYSEVPIWWWGVVLVVSWVVGLVCLYQMKSTLPWWGFLLATIFTFLFTLFFGSQYGLTGFGFNTQPICQMLAGYMFPGRPLANFYFTCYTYNATSQAFLLAKDLRLAQYSHLAPFTTFWLQVSGCLIGALLNFLMMLTIVDNQGDILRRIQGTNIWSGQNIQQFNSLAIAWSIAPKMFSVGARYQYVTIAFLLGFLVPIPTYVMYRWTKNKKWGYLNPSIILWFSGNLFVGINSGFTSFFLIAFFSQYYLRKHKIDWFVKYNYLVSAALDGGTQVMVFILTFAVAGGSGVEHPFPKWAGNPDTSKHNNDYCMVDTAQFAKIGGGG